jgi:D-alanyl-lipoteichoic acid acyltransferase DltB (MBOAT superfamily)
MLFNSLSFAIFLPIVFILYWIIGPAKLRSQNVLLIVSSYYFYACWDWRFLFLLVFSTLLDFYSGVKISKANSQHSKKIWLFISVAINLGILGVFKYYNFFASSFADALSLLGVNVNMSSLEVILPVGISFYTFHGLSYVVDIYNKKIDYEKDFINYSLFVSFFPLLVAGPIERATHLLPQIIKRRDFSYNSAVDGLRQILWGLFKKIVIADNCAEYANMIFNNSADYNGSTLFLGALFFTFQIYGDFSGYSDIALGTARLFGIELLRNFAYPYFSRDIAEFWRRWHISLSSWFRDYLYIPLGGSKYGKSKAVRNTFIIFIVSGFWHGANWTFIFWGLLNALFILPSILANKNRVNMEIVAKGKYFPTFKEFYSIALTFVVTVFAWIFFRANSLSHAFNYISGIFSISFFSIPVFNERFLAMQTLVLVFIFMVIEWLGRENQYALAKLGLKWHAVYRFSLYYLIIFSLYWYSGKEQQFIYFQF